jgi:hypothetical protein
MMADNLQKYLEEQYDADLQKYSEDKCTDPQKEFKKWSGTIKNKRIALMSATQILTNNLDIINNIQMMSATPILTNNLDIVNYIEILQNNITQQMPNQQ